MYKNKFSSKMPVWTRYAFVYYTGRIYDDDKKEERIKSYERTRDSIIFTLQKEEGNEKKYDFIENTAKGRDNTGRDYEVKKLVIREILKDHNNKRKTFINPDEDLLSNNDWEMEDEYEE